MTRALLACGLLVAGACASPRTPDIYPAGSFDAADDRLVLHDRYKSIVEPPGFRRAVEKGTRTRTGRPGPAYWQQYARYQLSASLDTASKLLTGSGRIRYHNRSPDALRRLAVHLYQNLYAPDAQRNRPVPITGGVTLTRVALQGANLGSIASTDTTKAGFRTDGTIAWIHLGRSLASGDSVDLDVAWSFMVPSLTSSPRMGQDGEVFHLAYWYPQFAVYDDVSGWQVDQYMGTAEFYMGYADYDVSLRVPAGWLVVATGELANPAQVLSPAARGRLDRLSAGRGAVDSGIVHIVTADERGPGRATAGGGADRMLTWRFTADQVRDFAWTTSSRYVWDAARVSVGDADGDGAGDFPIVHALYRPDRTAWRETARYARHSIDFLSRFVFPYPYPHMTVVEGLGVGGGMEFPMTTFITGSPRDSVALYSVTLHEIAHMWFPMIVGSDEKRNMWQDEGMASFLDVEGAVEFFPGIPRATLAGTSYERAALAGTELEVTRHGDHYMRDAARTVAAYDKPMVALHALRGLLGEETFMRAYREYGRRWTNRHPQPQDLFNTFNDVSGRDLSWFWRTWFYETWTLDQAIAGVQRSGDRLLVTVEDRGSAPMPARLVITRTDGTTERAEIPVEYWLQGHTRGVHSVERAGTVSRIEIDPDRLFPDLDRTNQSWTP
ncbi:MAG: M1 family metallopeptidase [Gemmatimonadaceae bacterium]